MKNVLLLLLFLVCGCGKEKTIKPMPDPDDSNPNFKGNAYQIGSAWNRLPLTKETIIEAGNSPLSLGSLSTVKIVTLKTVGTGFYLGKHAGYEIVATNAHVLENIISCNFSLFFDPPPLIKFEMQKKSFRCGLLIGVWPEIDMALMAIRKHGQPEFFAGLVPLRFDWENEVLKGDPLITMGFGGHQNQKMNLTYDDSSHCQVFSEDGQFKKVLEKGSSRRAAGKREVWSFATGCDVSQGDSGSPVIRRKTGEVIGLVWATKSPKIQSMSNDGFIGRAYENSDSVIWDQFSFAVPAQKIKESLKNWLRERNVPPYRKRIIRSLINR